MDDLGVKGNGSRAAPDGNLEAVTEAAVWRMCRVMDGDCQNCPAVETIDGEEWVRGCYSHAVQCINTAETGNPWRKTEVGPPWAAYEPNAVEGKSQSHFVRKAKADAKKQWRRAEVAEAHIRRLELAFTILADQTHAVCLDMLTLLERPSRRHLTKWSDALYDAGTRAMVALSPSAAGQGPEVTVGDGA